MSNSKKLIPVKIPRGFENVARSGRPYGSAIRAKKGVRMVVNGDRLSVSSSTKDVEKIIREQRKRMLLRNPTPQGMTRREFTKMHTLPWPFKMKYRLAYTKMSRAWWDKLHIDVQKEFRKQYTQPEFRRLFPVTANSKKK
jgi:hypothetical protein